ncbi:hypothetical protein H0H92_013188 [Tricholoma furcatifolium]|nr:hypothetical protein H0H92_013188 [Tricholoma furcatifolium]
MLRWQPTVRALDGYGIYAARVFTRSSRLRCDAHSCGILGRRLHKGLPESVASISIPGRHMSTYPDGLRGQSLTKHHTSKVGGTTAVTRRPPRPPLDPENPAFKLLSDFLSRTNTISYPDKISLDTLRIHYARLKSEGQLNLLSPKEFTELISLFGTLSLPDSRNGLIYLSKLVPHVASKRSDEKQWDFVIEVARDKQKVLRTKLNGTDGFWLMRALLTKVALAEGETLSPGDPREQALSEATQQYLRIWRHAYHVDIHLPLLQKWFDLGTQKDTVTLVNRLCRVLELHVHPNSHLIEVLWRLILRSTLPLGAALKARILSMVNTRLSPQFAQNLQAHGEKRQKNPSSTRLDSTSSVEPSNRILGTPELSNALGTALFPTYAPGTQHASPEVKDWATEQARQAFAPAVTQDVQWGNLLLLAIHQSERLNLPPPHHEEEDTPASETIEGDAKDWRPVLVLNALERTTGGMPSGMALPPDTREGVKGIVRPLWSTWKAGDDGTRPLNAATSRPIAAAFFRMAAKIVDGPLTDAIHRFCVKHDLFRGAELAAAEAQRSWADLNAAYVLAVAVCRGVGWQTAFEETHISGDRDLVLTTLFFHYVLTDLSIGIQVFNYAQERGYKLGDWPVHMMGLKLATPQTWQLAVPLLERPGISRQRTEELLIAILRVFQQERRQYVDPTVAKILGDTLWKLYETTPPPTQFKYPIRFFFSIMIASGQPVRAISVVEAIHRKAPPTFFTTRLFLRLMRTLVRYRYFNLTHRVHRLVPTDPANARSAADFRRKLTLSLSRAGASHAARRAYAYGIDIKHPEKVWRTPREAMARAVKFNDRKPSSLHTLPIVSILNRAPTHPPTIQYAATLLVRAQRAYAARKVLQRSVPHLDSRTITTIGNTILDGLLTRRLLRNGRLVRHLLRTKEHMLKTFGFKLDRVTINILVKSLLRWHSVLDILRVKALFDHMVRMGYPASERWCHGRAGGVPFGTSAASLKVNVPVVEEKILFHRHVRPLYKMFARALFVRGDRVGAQTVVGILKDEEVHAVRHRQVRDRARLAGVMRKNLGQGGRKKKKGDL